MDKQEDLKNIIATYKGVILDFDGTIVDLGVDWEELKKDLSKYCLDNKSIAVNFTQLDSQLLKMKNRYGEKFYFDLMDIIEKYELDEENYKINFDLLDIINSLKETRVAIYSMNTMASVNNFIKKYFRTAPEIIISKENSIEPKPTDKDILSILKKWNLYKNEVIFIGNSDYDLNSGMRANIKTVILSI